MKRVWIYLQNVFENTTRKSFTKFMKISIFHYNAINAKAGDAFFDSLMEIYAPLHSAFSDLFAAWEASKGSHMGGTATVDDLLHVLSSEKIEDWDVAIKVVYKKGTPQYIALLPHGHTPFQTGTKDQRMLAVRTLSEAIGANASLAAVKTSVDNFYDSLLQARSDQQGEISGTSEFSGDLELARVAAGKGMYKNLGLLMAHYSETPESVAPFFDLETIRSAQQEEFTGHVLAHDNHFIAKRTLEPEDVIRLINTGTVPLVFHIAEEKNDPVATPSVTIAAGEEELVPASSLGIIPGSKFLKVYNNSNTEQGNFKIQIQ